MSLKNKSILVTGGSGFIGSHLIDRLIKEDPQNLIIVDNFFLGNKNNLNEAIKRYPELKVYNQDASDYTAMAKMMSNKHIDVVFNLAVIPLPTSLIKPMWTFEQNINITLSICELARNNYFNTLIHFSSSEAYGTCKYAPMDENHPLNCTTPYAASKASSDQLVFSYSKTFGIDTAIIRPFNNYGPRQNEKNYAGVIPLTIKRILGGEPPVIYGDGKQTRDYLYVTDTANAAIDIYNSKNTQGKVLNIASGKEIPIETLIKMIAEYLDCNIPIIYKQSRLGDVRRHVADINLAEELIDFKPTVSFEEGLKLTVEWYKENLKT